MQVTGEFLEELREALEKGNDGFVAANINSLHGSDVAAIMHEITLDQRKYVFKLLPNELAAETLLELDEDFREELLESLTNREIAAHIDEMDSDDAADMLGDLPDERKHEIISEIKDKEQVEDIVHLLTYDENTAGAIMARELIKVHLNQTVDRCVVELRQQAHQVENVYTIYVVNDHDILVGLLSLKSLLVATAKTPISQLYNEKIRKVVHTETKENVALIMQKYDLVVLPVVDENGVLLGRITIDDVVDVIKEEADKDYQMMSGLSENVESHDTIWVVSRARLPWLIVAMAGGIIASRIIGVFDEVIKLHPEMTFFTPLIAAMGGNVGIQSSAIVVQGLANNTIDYKRMFPRLAKEFAVALLNGSVCASLILVYGLLVNDSMALSFTVCLALFSVIVFAAIFGTMIPLVLHRNKIDPAIATGPFITTTNDILGIVLYFSISHWMYY
ncbi:MAG TPA: magnesium transporter [Flavobacteriales bacterium]|nr:magnesium transporter [Flavobacteriales bacterium]